MICDLVVPKLLTVRAVSHIEVVMGLAFDLRLRGTRGQVIWTEQNDAVLSHTEEPSQLVSHVKAMAVGISYLRVYDSISKMLITINVVKENSDVKDEAATLNLSADEPK